MSNASFYLRSMLSGTWVLFISLFLMMLGSGLQSSLLGIRGFDEGFSTLTLSLIASGYYLGYLGGSFIVPNYIKRVGYVRVFAALVAIASVAAVAYAMFVEESAWFMMRVLTGFCFAGIYMVAESWLNSQTHNENRAKVLGLYVITLFLGMSVGQLFLNLGDISGYYLFAIASILISVAAVPLLLTSQQAPASEETSSLSVFDLFKRSPLGTVSSFFANFINGAVAGMAAIYAKTVDMPTDKISLFVASAFIGVILFQFPVGYLSDRIDRRKVIVGLCALSICIVFLLINADNITTLIIYFGLLGGVTLPLYAVCLAYVNDRLEPHEVLPATSALLKISGVGNMMSPLIVGYMMTKYGDDWFFGVVGIAAAIVFTFGFYRMLTGQNIDVEEQGDYAPLGMGTTAATMSLTTEGMQLEFDFGDAHRRPEITEESQTTEG